MGGGLLLLSLTQQAAHADEETAPIVETLALPETPAAPSYASKVSQADSVYHHLILTPLVTSLGL